MKLWSIRTPDIAAATRHLYLLALGRPFTLPLGLAATVVGCLATWYGIRVSAALSIITPEAVIPGNTITRLWGILQVIGGIQVLRGVLLPRLGTERSGWSILIAADIFYSVGLIGGLGLAGSAAGTYLAALALGSILRTLGLKKIQAAKQEAVRSREDR